MNRNPFLVAASVAVVLDLSAHSAFAADTPEDPREVVVTATRYPVPRDQVLPATFVVERDELQRSLATDVADVLRFRSGVELGRNGGTVLLSSHLMNEVEQVCDRVGVIAGGTLVAEGTVEELRGSEFLLLRADPIARAERLVASLRGVDEVTRVDGALRVAAGALPAAELNRALVEAGIGVAELRPERTSLEDVFFELTRNEEVHA